jgi:hypothetical protein
MVCFHFFLSLLYFQVVQSVGAVAHQFTVGAAGFTLSSEVSSLPLRPVTQSIVGVTQGILGWVLGFVTPYMITLDEGNLGVKVGFVIFRLVWLLKLSYNMIKIPFIIS